MTTEFSTHQHHSLNMTLALNDPSLWPVISASRQASYYIGSWRANIALDNFDGGFVVTSVAVMVYDWGAQDNVYEENY